MDFNGDAVAVDETVVALVRRLRCEPDSWFHLGPDVRTDRVGRQIRIQHPGGTETALMGAGDVLAAEDARRWAELGLGSVSPRSIFDDKNLNDALFGYSAGTEIEFLRRMVGEPRTAGLGLDIGCGSGRLLTPMRQSGYRLDGLDPNAAALAQIAAGGDLSAGGRLYCAAAEDWHSPAAYDWSFAALNTLRYLPSRWAFRRHLSNMAASLKPGAPYLINVTVNSEPDVEYGGEWEISYAGQAHDVRWDWDGYDRDEDLIREHVTIRNRESLDLIADEYQWQLALRPDELFQLVGLTDAWQLTDVFDRQGRRLPRRLYGATGTFWFVLERR